MIVKVNAPLLMTLAPKAKIDLLIHNEEKTINLVVPEESDFGTEINKKLQGRYKAYFQAEFYKENGGGIRLLEEVDGLKW